MEAHPAARIETVKARKNLFMRRTALFRSEIFPYDRPMYEMVIGYCFGCKNMFTFNAERVPSIPINGVREPVCETCVQRVNPMRIANGLDPIIVLPGAYEPEER